MTYRDLMNLLADRESGEIAARYRMAQLRFEWDELTPRSKDHEIFMMQALLTKIRMHLVKKIRDAGLTMEDEP